MLDFFVDFFKEEFYLTGFSQYFAAIVAVVSVPCYIFLWVLFFCNPEKVDKSKHLGWYSMVSYMRERRNEVTKSSGKRNEWMFLTLPLFMAPLLFLCSPGFDLEDRESLMIFIFGVGMVTLPMLRRFIGMIIEYHRNKNAKSEIK